MSGLRGPITWIISLTLLGAFIGRFLGVVSQTGLDQVGVITMGWTVFRLLETGGLAKATIGAILSAGVLQWVWTVVPGMALMPYLLILSSHLFIAWAFVNGQIGGREPILLRLIRMMDRHPLDDPGFCRFIRGQCWLWAGLALTMAVLSLIAMLLASRAPWIADLLLLMVLAQVLWFMLSHHYATARYGRPETWWWTARTMVRREFWAQLINP